MKLFKEKTLTLKQKYTHRIGFLPDLHCGESRAVMGDEFVTEENQVIKPNRVQEIINKQWKRVAKQFDELKVQDIFMVGDGMGGINYLESGRYMFIRLPDQIRLAADLLETVSKNRKIYVWRGTQYHEYPKGVGEAHEELVSKLRERGIEAEFMGPHSYVELIGKQRVRRLFIAHECPTGLVYPATLLSRRITWALEGEAAGTTLPVDAIIQAHGHHWLHVDHSGIHGVALPCWLAHTPYKATIKYFFKLQPTIGGAVMVMDECGRLDFWGGSYPFSLTRAERLELHRACIKVKKLEPIGSGVEHKCLS